MIKGNGFVTNTMWGERYSLKYRGEHVRRNKKKVIPATEI